MPSHCMCNTAPYVFPVCRLTTNFQCLSTRLSSNQSLPHPQWAAMVGCSCFCGWCQVCLVYECYCLACWGDMCMTYTMCCMFVTVTYLLTYCNHYCNWIVQLCHHLLKLGLYWEGLNSQISFWSSEYVNQIVEPTSVRKIWSVYVCILPFASTCIHTCMCSIYACGCQKNVKLYVCC